MTCSIVFMVIYPRMKWLPRCKWDSNMVNLPSSFLKFYKKFYKNGYQYTKEFKKSELFYTHKILITRYIDLGQNLRSGSALFKL